MINKVLGRFIGLICKAIAYPLMHWPAIINARIRGWSGQNNIKKTHNGEAGVDSDCVCIFLIWQPDRLSPSVERALQALNQCNIDVIVVSNSDMNSDTLTYIRNYSSKVIIRGNRGYDFGGFKDATLLLEREKKYNRYIYLNDSVFFFNDGLIELFQQLKDSRADVCGAFENWEFNYHIQSFCFSISKKIFFDEKFISFWMKYLPANSRVHAIKKGEILLTQLLRKVACHIEVIYTLQKLKEKLDSDVSNDHFADWNFIPSYMRPQIIETVVSLVGIDASEKDKILWNNVSQKLVLRSQIHTAGFLFMKYLNAPIIKKDIVYRLQFFPHDVEIILSETGKRAYADELMNYIRKKGSGNELPLYKRILFHAGLA